MPKKLFFLLCFTSVFAGAKAAYVPLTLTGYNADVIANGSVSVAASTTLSVDNAGYYFLDQSFTALGTPTFFLPASGTLNSITTSGLSFQLAGASGNNSLQLGTQGASGTLTLTTPQSAGVVYLLVTSGSGNSTVDVTITFTDGTTQTFTGQSINDWYGGAQTVIQGIGRTSATALDNSSGSTNPRLYQMALSLLSSNYTKLIASISVTKTNATGTYPNIMGASIQTVCAAPTAQPTALVLSTLSTTQINGSFTAASPAPDQYLVVRYPAAATPTNPVNGTAYNVGDALGLGTVVQAGAATTFSATGLTGSTSYAFYIYSLNNISCAGAPVYNTSAPLTGTQATSACSGPGGLITVGPTGTYPTLTAALAAIATGNSGAVTMELQSNYVSTGETFPIVIGNSGCISQVNPLTIRPAAGAVGLLIGSSNAGPTIDLSGASFVTIDGTPGGSSSASAISVTASGSLNATNLNIVNTSASGAAIRLDNGASRNRILLCDLQGQNTVNANVPTTLAGVVYFGNNGALGNDNNLVDRCNIHSTSTTVQPSIGLYALGAVNNGFNINFNDNDTVRGCNIYDYFLPGNNSCGLELNQGVSGWTISNNHFFQTATRTYTATGYNRGIWLIPDRNSGSVGNGFTISGNYIGGSAPLCGGTAYTLMAQSNSFDAIRLETVDGATANPTSVQNNTITNLSVTSTSTGDAFHAMWVSSRGATNIGTVTGNTVGTMTGSGGAVTGGITVAAGNGSPTHMIIVTPAGGTPVCNIRKNKLGNIRLANAGNHFSGIFANNNPTVLIDSNQVGSLTTAHSIVAASAAATACNMRGILIPSGSGNITITNNTVANLTDSTTSTGTSNTNVTGIAVLSTTATVPSITGNTVRNLLCHAPSAGGGQNAAVLGICMMSTAASTCDLSRNTIHSLVSSAGSGSLFVTGMFLRGSSSSTITYTVTKNRIHSFDLSAANTNASFRGIETSQGKFDVINNMVRLGIRPDGTSMNVAARVDGILEGASLNSNYYFNSVYIGGTGVGSGNGSACFRKESAGGAGLNAVKNNILVNERSNTATGGVHYALCVNTAANITYANNLYRYSGIGGAFASTSGVSTTPTAAAYSPGWAGGDLNSVVGDPQFIAATGNAASVDLHINTTLVTPVEATGTPITGITDDVDGDLRSSFSPTDIGADAGNFTAAQPCVTPVSQPTNLVLTPISATQINGSFTASVPAAGAYLVVACVSGNTPVAPVNGFAYAPGSALGNGVVVANGPSTTFNATGLLGATPYVFYVYAYNDAGCLYGPVYQAVSPLTGNATTLNCNSVMTGTVPVGPGQTYTTLTAALAYLNTNGLGGPVTLELQNNYVSTGETFPVTISNFGCLSPVNPLIIRPAAGSVGLSISSSNAGPTIDLSGASFVTIDGTPGGSSSASAISVTASGSLNATNLNIVNTSASGAAIRLDNGASRNRILLCDLQGQNTVNANVPTTLAGVVYFGNNGALGNDNNLVDRCNIHSTSTTVQPSIGLYALGAVNNGFNINFNDNDTVRGCNIYDYFLPGNNSCGLELNQGVNGWTISNNHFFQTATRTYTATGYNRGIWLIPDRNSGSMGNGFTISGNYIGGSAPLCGGTAYTLMAQSNSFDAIRLETVDGSAANPTSVQNNTITNLSVTSTSTGDAFHAMWVSSRGATNIGTVTGNTVGTMTGSGGAVTGGITVAAGNGSPTHMIIVTPAGGTPVCNIRKNKLGNIRLANAGNHFSGIFANNNPTVLIDSNQVGSLTTAHSIVAASAAATACNMRGILIPSGSGNITITNNTVANLTDSSTSTSGTNTNVTGIAMLSSTAVVTGITGNTVSNLQNSAPTTGGAQNAAVLGICMMGTTANAYDISNNTIHSLTSTAVSATVFVTGMFLQGSSTASVLNTVSKNRVHSFDLTAANAVASFRGIETNQGRYQAINNMVRLGIRPDGTFMNAAARVDGILEGAGMNSNYYFNSIYIGGTGVGAGNGSACFRKETTGGAGQNEVKNNIFVNERSNATTGGVHYALCVNSSSNITYDYNLYRYSGTGGAFASTAGISTTPTAAAYTAGWISGDVNSVTGDPQFIAPAANAAALDLHINPNAPSTPVEGTGTVIAGVSDDIDGDLRSAASPTDIGADAGNFGPLPCIVAPVAPLMGSAVCATPVLLKWNKTGLATAYDVYLNAGTSATTLVSGNQTDTTYTTATLSPGVYTWKVFPKNTTGIAIGCDSFVFTVSAPPAIVVQPQPQTAVCAGTAASFSVDATGDSLTYQWYLNGNPISGATADTYHVAAAAFSDTGNYTVVVQGTILCGNITSAAAHLTVHPLPQPVITANNFVLSTGSYSSYQWYYNGVPIVGETSQSYAAFQNGSYSVLVTDANGCSNTSSPYVVSTISVPYLAGGKSIRVYPNPGNGIMHIKAPMKVNVTVHNISGRIILEQKDANEVSFKESPDGLYLVVVTDAATGQMLLAERITKVSK